MRTRITLLVLLLAAAPAAAADDAKAVFNSLYGAKVKAAQLSPDRGDDVSVAQELLQGTALVTQQPELLAVICETAYDLGKVDPAGHTTAIAAMQKLAEHVPGRKADALEKIIDLRQKQFGTARGDERTIIGTDLILAQEELAGMKAAEKKYDEAGTLLRKAMNIARLIKSDRNDALKAALDAIVDRQRVQTRIDKLQADITAKPGDAAAVRDLVLLHISELDDPAEAGSLLLLTKDESLKKRVTLAGKPLSAITEADALDLGEWYRGLADQTAAPLAKRKMLTRATIYLKQYLATHTASDLTTAKAQLMVGTLTTALDKLGGPVTVSIPQTAEITGTPTGSALTSSAGPIDLSRLKPLAFVTSEEASGLELVEVEDSPFSRAAMAGQRCIVMEATNLYVKIDDKIARDLPQDKDERWFVRLHMLDRLGGHVGVHYDGHMGGYPPNGDGVHSMTPWQQTSGGNNWMHVDLEMPLARFNNRQKGGADLRVSVGPNMKPAYIQRIELHRVKLPPVAQRTIKPGASADILKLVDPGLDTVLGNWELTKTGLRCSPRFFARISAPVVIRGSYDMKVKFVRLEGAESVNITLPVGERQASLMFDAFMARGGFSGIETISGKQVNDNPSAVAGAKLTNGKEHTADIRVRLKPPNAEIEVDLDGQPLIKWNGLLITLTGSAWRLQESQRPGFGSYNLPVEIRAATIKMIDGDAVLLSPGGSQDHAAKVDTKNTAPPATEPGASLASMNEQVVFAKIFGKSGKLGSLVHIRIAGVDLPGSLAMFPDRDKPARIAYQIDGKYRTFLGAVGINDMGSDPQSDVTFSIFGDGKELWRSRPIRQRELGQPFQVNVAGVKKLEIQSSAAGDPAYCNCVWVEPTLHEKDVRITLTKHASRKGKLSFFGVPVE